MRRRLNDESGVAVVMFALAMPFLILFCALAIDVGNWFVHKRHLQTQADAAALAGAGAYTFPVCDNNVIQNTALQYSGKGDGSGTIYNPPDDVKVPQARLHAELNQPDYFDQPGNPGDTDLPATPCDAMFLDVKMTETATPWIFGTGVVDFINARARVQLFQIKQAEGVLPLGVQEAAPRKVRAYVVDESTGTEVGSVELTSAGASGGLLQFNNDAAPLSLSVPESSGNLGVRLALSGGSSTTCGQPLVNCYDNVSANGLSYIRTWTEPTAPATNERPAIGSVFLSPNTCDNASFGSKATSCTMDVTAKVKWNPAVTATNIATGGAKLTVQYNGSPYVMAYDAGTATWTATGVPIPAGTAGPRSVSIDWEQTVGSVTIIANNGTPNVETCSTAGGNKCKGTFTNVQRTFWNDPEVQGGRGGPVGQLDVLDSTSLQQVSDLQKCAGCTANLVFQVGIEGALELSEPGDPPRSLRVAGSGSQNQTLDCDPAAGFVDEIAYGCKPPYQINEGTPCSSPTSPLSCVPVQTGTTANKPAQGFNTRFLCAPPGNPGNCKGTTGAWDGKPDTCPAAGEYGHNNWPNYPVGDPRVVSVFLVPFGTFEAQGTQLVPILDFAAFYVTGWASNGNGWANPCIGNGDQFHPGTDADQGVVSGHFVKRVNPNPGGSGVNTCDLNDIGECVAVLVK